MTARIPPKSNRNDGPSRTKLNETTNTKDDKSQGPGGPDNEVAKKVFDKLLARMVEQAGDRIATTRKELEKFAQKRGTDEDEE